MASKTFQVSYVESKLRLGVGILLWSISALLSLHLFLSFSDKTLFQNLLLGASAIGLEATKILTWKNPRTRIFSAVLIILSITASLGAALEVVDASAGTLHTTTMAEMELNPAYQAKKDEIASINSEINTLIIRLGLLPSDYTTAATKISATLTERRTTKQALLDSLTSLSGPSETSAINSIFIHLGRFFHVLPESVMFLILLVMAGALEVGGFILTAPVSILPKKAVNEALETKVGESTKSDDIAAPTVSYEASMGDKPITEMAKSTKKSKITPEMFLEAAKEDSVLPVLHGRDVTAQKVCISFAEAKRMVSILQKEGKIKIRGKRMFLVEKEAV